jgi:hypothetical protein
MVLACGVTMNKESKLRLASEMLTQHMKDSLPGDETKIEDIDLLQVDASVCNLVANLIRFDGNLQTMNDYYEKAGSSADFNTMILDVQGVLDKVLPRLEQIDQRAYFARLSRMSVIAAEVGISQAGEGLIIAASEGFGEQNLRVTADLDEGLRAFREQMAKQRPMQK